VKHFRLPVATLFATALILLGAAPAWSSDTWQEAARGAVAILPVPEKAAGITAGSLFCAEQRWSFLFYAEPGLIAAGSSMEGKVTVGGEAFAVEAVEENGLLNASVPFEILQPLRDASRMGVEIGAGETALSAVFPLRGSRAVIEAVAPRCSQVDMSAYQRVTLSETDPAVAVAEKLLAEEAKLFREATGIRPVYAAKTLELADGKALLFASICGSKNYYGDSGCSLSGFARTGAGAEWLLVYDTEGVLIHIDPEAANGGFPTIVTLPVVGGVEPSHWVWTGTAYEVREEVMAEQDHIPGEGDSAR